MRYGYGYVVHLYGIVALNVMYIYVVHVHNSLKD